MKRSSGILLHISSLPGPGGIGSLGKEAFQFADFLQESGCRVWQVLPMGPTGYGESPYQSSSVFAGNPLLISLETLRQQGLLACTEEELQSGFDDAVIDFPMVRKVHERLLFQSFEQSEKNLQNELEQFVSEQPWVEDFALFTALKHEFNDVMWSQWPDEDVRRRKKSALKKWRKQLDVQVRFHIFCQYLFEVQWQNLHRYCHEKGIELFGDMPIYVAEDSADTWTHPEVFQLDKKLLPKRVAGVPPDYFSADGQLWGNPLYDWKYLQKHHFDWWLDRMHRMSELYDIIRIDHFIGFANYYSIPYGAPNAREGEWIKAPGKKFFKTLKKSDIPVQIIAEDLGCVNKRVRRLIDYTGYPGMRVLVFGFTEGEANVHALPNWVENSVAYTGTHDNDTVLGYLKRAEKTEVDMAKEQLGFKELEDGPAAFVKATFDSVSRLCVIPMQDILGLDNSARMNTPSTIGGNWGWRMKELPDASIAERLLQLNKESERG